MVVFPAPVSLQRQSSVLASHTGLISFRIIRFSHHNRSPHAQTVSSPREAPTSHLAASTPRHFLTTFRRGFFPLSASFSPVFSFRMYHFPMLELYCQFSFPWLFSHIWSPNKPHFDFIRNSIMHQLYLALIYFRLPDPSP